MKWAGIQYAMSNRQFWSFQYAMSNRHLLIACCQLPVAHCQMPAAYCKLPIATYPFNKLNHGSIQL